MPAAAQASDDMENITATTTGAPNIRQLAILIGRHRGTVLDWTLAADWPVGRTGPFTADDVAKVRAWADRRPRRTATT